MNKRLFQVLDEMNQADTQNKTRLVAVSNTFIGADSVKAGAKITMGADFTSMQDIVTGKGIALLLVVDKAEYDKLSKL